MTEPNILESEKFKTIIGFLTSNESGINQGIMFLETFPDLFKLFKPPSNSHGTWLGVEKIEIKMNAKVKINKRVSISFVDRKFAHAFKDAIREKIASENYSGSIKQRTELIDRYKIKGQEVYCLGYDIN